MTTPKLDAADLEDVVASIEIAADRIYEATNADDAYDARLDLKQALKEFRALLEKESQ
jgi:hypothetical protein